MKTTTPKASRRSASILAGSIATLVLALSGPAVHATALYWDTNTSATPGSGAVTGTWGTDLFWNDDPLGLAGGPSMGVLTATTTSTDDVFFSAGANGTGGTVTVSGTQAANSITFQDVNATKNTNAITLSGGTALTIGGGANAGIFVASGDNQQITISTAINLAGNSTIRTQGSGTMTLSGNIGGTGNLILKNDNADTLNLPGGITIGTATTTINNSGTLTNSGTGFKETLFNGSIGSNVTAVIQDSGYSAFRMINTNNNNGSTFSLITVNSGGTTFQNNGVQTLSIAPNGNSGGTARIDGTGDLIFKNNSSSAIPNGVDVNGLQYNILIANTGQVINNGTGVGGTRINAQISNTITALIQDSPTSNMYLIKAIGSPGAGNVTQVDNNFTAPTYLKQGLLYMGYNNALGGTAPASTSSINFQGGTLAYGVNTTLDYSSKFVSNGADYKIDTNGQKGTVVNTTFASVLAASGSAGFQKLGAGSVTLTGANLYTGTTTIGGGTATLESIAGGTLNVGNGTIGSLNAGTGTALTFKGTGTFNVNEGTASNQMMQMLTFQAGDGTVQSQFSATSANLTFSSLAARTAGGTGNFQLSGGSAGTSALNAPGTLGSNNIIIGGQSSGVIDQGYFFTGTSGVNTTGYAYYDPAGFVRALDYTNDATPANAATSAGGTSLSSVLHQEITGSITAQAAVSFRTLKINGANNLTIAEGNTVSVNGLLKTGANASVIQGGSGLQTTNNAEMVINTANSSDLLTINTPLLANGTNALTKSGLGTLVLSGKYSYTGSTNINAGTMVFRLPASQTQSYSGAVTGPGALVINGEGALILNGTQTTNQTGGLTITSGNLVLDFANMATPTNLINPVSKLTLGSGSAINGDSGGANIKVIAKTGAGVVTSQSFSLVEPTGSVAPIVTNIGAHKLLVDTNGGQETRILLGAMQNVLGFTSTLGNQQPSNGSGLLIGKSAGSGSGNVVFVYDTGGRNGPTYGTNLGGRLLFTSDGGTTVDFVTATQQSISPYNIVPVGTLGTAYSTLTATSGGGGNQGPYYLLTGGLTLTNGGDATGVKIVPTAPGQTWNLNGLTYNPDFGLLITGPYDYTISNGIMTAPNQGSGRSINIDQYSSGTLTISATLGTATFSNSGEKFTKLGPGTLVLSGQNSWTGNTFLSEGITRLGSANVTPGATYASGPLGNNAGSIFFGGGTLQYSAANTFDYSSRFNTGQQNPIKIDTNSQNVSFATNLSSPGGSLTKLGAGTLTLNASNSYSGPTKINGGTLVLGATGLLNSTSSITILGGATYDVSAVVGYALAQNLLAPGTGTASVTGDFNANAKVVNLQDRTNLGTLAFGGLLNVGGATLNFDLGNSGSDLITATSFSIGSVTINVGALTAATSLTTGAQAYTLATSGASANLATYALSFNTLTVNNVTYQLSLTNDATSVFLGVSAGNNSALELPGSGVLNVRTNAIGNPGSTTVTNTSTTDDGHFTPAATNLTVAPATSTLLTHNISGTATANIGLNWTSVATAGVRTGSVTITNTDNPSDVSNQSQAFTGGVFDYANPGYTGGAKAFGNVRPGTVLSDQTVSFTNAAITSAAYQDSLDVSATTPNAKLTLTGFNGLLADGAAQFLNIAVDTITAGSLASTLTLNLASNANGVAGLTGQSLSPASPVTTTGGVYDYATATHSGGPLALGNVRVGAGNLYAITNTLTGASASYQDSLDVTATDGGNVRLTVTAPGNILADTSNNVTYTAVTAGDLTATSALGFTSNHNGVAGLSDLALTGANLGITGTAYDFANASFTGTTLAFGNVRAGSSPTGQNVAFTNPVITSAPLQDSLDVTAGNANVTATGFTGLLVGGAAQNLVVSAITSTAGSLASVLQTSDNSLTLTSNANGVSGLSNANLISAQVINVTGSVYDFASPTNTSSSISFGTVHVGSSQSVAIGNAVVTSAAFQDTLNASGTPTNGNLSVTSFTGLAASVDGATTANLTVTAANATTGSLADMIAVNFTSNANGVVGLSNQTLTAGSITVTGSVFNGTGKWVSDVDTTWVSSGNWADSNSVAAAPGTFGPTFDNVDTANFDGIGTQTTVNLDGTSPSLKNITFSGAATYTLAQGTSGTITLKSGVGDPGITSTASVAQTISAPVALANANTQVSVGTGGTLILDGAITDTGTTSLTKTGAGKLNLNGAQSYDTLDATAGTTNVNGAFGAGAAVSVTGAGTSLKFGTVSQTLSSLSIGAGSTVTFTSGVASFGGEGGGKAPSFGGSAVVPEPGTIGLLLVGALGVLNRRRRHA